MAATPAADVLTEAHRVAQVRIRLETILRLQRLAPLLDLGDLAASTPGWLDAAHAVVGQQHQSSAALARTYFDAFRRLEIGEPWTATVAPPLVNAEQVRTSLAVTGPIYARRDIGRGLDEEEVVTRIVARSGEAGARHALAGGRDTILRSVARDDRSLGWARVAGGRACAFCAMLAGRGPVYRTSSSASFVTHDHCACGVEPVYRDDARWPGRAREYQALWAEATRGHSGQGAINAFRRAYEAG